MFLHPNPRAKTLKLVLNDSSNLPSSQSTSTNHLHLKISSCNPATNFGIPPTQASIHIHLTCPTGLKDFTLSPVYRRMLLTRPPVKTLTVKSVSCCGPASSRRSHHSNLHTYFDALPGPKDLKRKKGITIGALYDFAEKVAEQHRLCPLAPVDMLDEKGEVHPEIKFSGLVSIKSSKTTGFDVDPTDPFGFADPPFPPTWPPSSPRTSSSEREQRSEKAKAHLQAYSMAKTLAAFNEIPVPTLEEHDGKRVYYESLAKPYWLDNDYLMWNWRND